MIHAIVFLPLLGALIAGLSCRVISHAAAQGITTLFLCAAAACSFMVFKNVAIDGHSYTVELLRFLDTGNLRVSWALKVDSLTAVMLVVVTVVSALVHLYSIGYMHHDPHVPRFMAYLSLFTFFMLMLVTSDNLVQLFLGWEGVGLCSYLLIGFWYTKPSANAAAMKAFIVNRVGDFGFALGIFTIFLVFGSVQFQDILPKVAEHASDTIVIFGHSVHTMTLICLLLFIGSMGKSAQFGLHTWLPDAMEGPTPVSALIHAATMVTAGVFLVARCSPLFEYAPLALNVVTVVGALTCFFAATVALTQKDIKKVIAYSTCSQLGYMFFACGVSAYSAGIFHLMTHAFFKALLFLGAGSVIHAMSDEQNIFKMGGIWKKIPVTYVLMWIGSLALAGVYPFAGYYSKDIILEAAYMSHTPFGQVAAAVGLFVAFLTAFYSWRLLLLVFHGRSRATDEVLDHVHESPFVMLVPLLILSIGAVFSGWVGAVWLKMVDSDGSFWRGAIQVLSEHNSLEHAHHAPELVKLAPLGAGLGGILLAYICYSWMPGIPSAVARTFKPIYLFLHNKWYIDELYDFLFVRSSRALGNVLWKVVDRLCIDGIPNGSAWLVTRLSGRLSRIQTGYIYHYAAVMLFAVVGVLSWYVFCALR